MPTAKEAAERLGVSKQTVIRWLQAGKLEGTLNESKRGMVWDVDEGSVQRLIDDAEPDTPPESHAKTETASQAVVTALQQNLDDLRQQLNEKDNQLKVKDKEIENLQTLLGQAQSLTAQANSNVAKLTPSIESKSKLSKPWWRFWGD